MNKISDSIIRLRKEKNMSQEDLAEKINVSRQAVSKWEREESVPDIENISAIAELFNVSIDSIVSGKSEEEVKKYIRRRTYKKTWMESIPVVIGMLIIAFVGYFTGSTQAIPISAAVVFFMLGFFFTSWNKAWIVFLMIPVMSAFM